MKKVVNAFIAVSTFLIAATFLVGLQDDAFQKTGIWYKDIPGAFRYYVFWVLPYWWFPIIVLSVLSSLVYRVVTFIVEKLRSLHSGRKK
ncbi:MAG TPA: hypothetical protein VK167_11895 [Flavipsychrobacter sp.]|nr:hypothetical protein [Flavipsychrobacter sp.]